MSAIVGEARFSRMHDDPADPRNTGGESSLQTITLGLGKGMDDKLAQIIEDKLRTVAGVRNVTTDLPKSNVMVSFDARKVHAPSLHDCVFQLMNT